MAFSNHHRSYAPIRVATIVRSIRRISAIFMDWVEEAARRWKTAIVESKECRFRNQRMEAEITDQFPDQKIAWQALRKSEGRDVTSRIGFMIRSRSPQRSIYDVKVIARETGDVLRPISVLDESERSQTIFPRLYRRKRTGNGRVGEVRVMREIP